MTKDSWDTTFDNIPRRVCVISMTQASSHPALRAMWGSRDSYTYRLCQNLRRGNPNGIGDPRGSLSLQELINADSMEIHPAKRLRIQGNWHSNLCP